MSNREEHFFVISVAAELAGMHAQTLRQYDRLGLVTPARAQGGGRRYSDEDVELLREIQHLSQDEGVNLAGIKRILELTQRVNELEKEVEQLENTLDLVRKQQRNSRALVHVPRSQAVVVWTPEVRQRGQ